MGMNKVPFDQHDDLYVYVHEDVNIRRECMLWVHMDMDKVPFDLHDDVYKDVHVRHDYIWT